MTTTATGNVAKTDSRIGKVNALLTTLGNISGESETAMRDQLRAAWRDGRVDGAWLDRTVTDLHARINALVAPKPARPEITEETLPAGRYAIDGTDGATNATVFYVVKWWTGRKGRMISVYSHVAGREDARTSYPVALSVAARILGQGVRESSIRYGEALGECGVCGRELTNDDSRAAGIGPKCAARYGW